MPSISMQYTACGANGEISTTEEKADEDWTKLMIDHKLCQGSTGGRLNKKDGLTRYGDSHVKDKTS